MEGAASTFDLFQEISGAGSPDEEGKAGTASPRGTLNSLSRTARCAGADGGLAASL